MFFEKPVLNTEKFYTSTDLLKYVESILRYSRLNERRRVYRSNYSWLASRSFCEPLTRNELDKFKYVVHKLTSENCAVVAVKLQSITEEETSTAAILSAFEKLLEEQYNIQLMESNVKRAKETTIIGKRKMNRVCPELLPPGRRPTVSFILN
ncbi:uncharacterized protein LOC113515372 [Galleria mellonella]|uniref:Uncharacterized protein LOC113515372 n=1 Tax=Galleria mellonella TaxID=7137 RepID=A0ABM3MSK7_GALME|nr:uncharacterized protein LOC113515372 [Galleria mellonella]